MEISLGTILFLGSLLTGMSIPIILWLWDSFKYRNYDKGYPPKRQNSESVKPVFFFGIAMSILLLFISFVILDPNSCLGHENCVEFYSSLQKISFILFGIVIVFFTLLSYFIEEIHFQPSVQEEEN